MASRDIARSKKFFKKIGFEINDRRSAPHMVSMFLGSNRVILNLFPEAMLSEFMGGQAIGDTKESNEMLIAIGADSPEEVDEISRKAVVAGAKLYGKPGYKDGWMYGCGFINPDGNRSLAAIWSGVTKINAYLNEFKP